MMRVRRMRNRRGSPGAGSAVALLLLGLLAAGAGCAGAPRQEPPAGASDAYAPRREGARRPAEATRLHREAAALINTHPEQAEALLREALAADLFSGPTHNNLGVLLLQRGDLYGAASEFEWARKLMPGHPDPRVNLGLTLERAGRTDDAMDAYDSALEVYPGHVPSTQGLLRLQLRTGRIDHRTRTMLEEIAISGVTADWRSWAQRRLSMWED